VVATVAGVSLAAATCTAAASSPATATDLTRPRLLTAHPEHRPRPAVTRRHPITNPADAGRRTFGPGCGILPRTGPASKAALATTPLAAALSREPGLSELAQAFQRAGLTGMLSAARALTVFAPDDAAFYALGSGNLQALFTTRPDLVRVLEFDLVAGRVTPAELARHHVFRTVGGTKLTLARSGETFGVNNATVTCGNVQTSNATVYVVDRFIVPTGLASRGPRTAGHGVRW
jgi:uncharacterized surface protein with fasciclin (FAS1) repeats